MMRHDMVRLSYEYDTIQYDTIQCDANDKIWLLYCKMPYDTMQHDQDAIRWQQDTTYVIIIRYDAVRNDMVRCSTPPDGWPAITSPACRSRRSAFQHVRLQISVRTQPTALFMARPFIENYWIRHMVLYLVVPVTKAITLSQVCD